MAAWCLHDVDELRSPCLCALAGARSYRAPCISISQRYIRCPCAQHAYAVRCRSQLGYGPAGMLLLDYDKMSIVTRLELPGCQESLSWAPEACSYPEKFGARDPATSRPGLKAKGATSSLSSSYQNATFLTEQRSSGFRLSSLAHLYCLDWLHVK